MSEILNKNHFHIDENLDLNNIYKKPFYLVKNGCLNFIERESLIRKIKHYSISSNNELNNIYLKYLLQNPKNYTNDVIKIELNESDYSPWKLLNEISKNIEFDFALLCSLEIFKPIKKLYDTAIIGTKSEIIVRNENTLKIHHGVIFDTTNGSIIIDDNVEIYPFSVLAGPLYIGQNTLIKSAGIGGGVTIGNNCKISGEVVNSIIGSYTNKSHESALLNSYVGNWCNIAGYTNTANLKSNYSKINVRNQFTKFKTNTLKFGSLINDYVRLASGLTIMPGSFIDTCSTLMEAPVLKGYYKPFSYINSTKKYDLDVFISEISKIKKRRNIYVSQELEDYFNAIYTFENILRL